MLYNSSNTVFLWRCMVFFLFVISQMHLREGSLTADGTFAYVSQQAWIFHGSVKENILMGEAYNKSK